MSAGRMSVIGVVATLAVVHTFAADKPDEGAPSVAKAMEGKQGKPLKVFLMAGQSNMQGKARVKTIERLTLAGGDKQLYSDMMGADGKTIAPKGVYEVYFTEGRTGSAVEAGPARPGFSEESGPDDSFGPDYTFGIDMQKHLNEPFLIIKTAWGGKSLCQQFRPPSAIDGTMGKDKFGHEAGYYYQLMIKHVREVLADPGKYHPAYNKDDGYEIAGFAWFHGYNDMIQSEAEFYRATETKPQFAEYTRLMACFIRDVRKDLGAPKMPFVIGVVGFDGPIADVNNSQYKFREAQAVTASLPEFAGNVVAVRTAECWDMELQRLIDKVHEACKKKLLEENPKMGPRAISQAIEKGGAAKMAPEALSPEEFKLYQAGQSNAAFHYMGSAQIYGKIGKVLAEGMAKMVK